MEDENPTIERKPRRHITLKEQLGLSEYIKANHSSWVAAALTQVQILDKCRAYLGWELNINTMRDIFRAMEIALPQRQAADPVKKSEHVQILADCMADLYRQLGQPLPSKLAQMLGEL